VSAAIEAATAVFEGAVSGGSIVVITGAGISVESGLRPYRGAGGRWTDEGASAMKKATAAYFLRHPEKSWAWHLDRRSEVLAAAPNRAHDAIALLERSLGDRFTLITQNIDRLHLRAGGTPERTIELHGYLDGMRCSGGCEGIVAVPEAIHEWESGDSIGDEHFEILVCPVCGLVARPHVLWFDEFYDEKHYRIVTAQRAVANTSVCITAGTSGGVPIAVRLAGIAVKAGAKLIDINPNNNELRQLAVRSGGVVVEESASEAMPLIAQVVREHGHAPKSRSEE
jgi:NAD-dependent deacetylase